MSAPKDLFSLSFPPDKLDQISAVSLAYLGDAVYELYIRSKFILPPKRIARYHKQVVAQVRAETQAKYLQHLDPDLTESERMIVMRGRNAGTSCPKRLDPKIYQQATSLETLIGYLYLKDQDRLAELLGKLETYMSNE